MAPMRQVIHVPGMDHAAPISQAVKMGNMIFTSAVSGRDTETGKLGDGPAEQAELAFKNLRKILAAAGAGPEHVAHVTVFLQDSAHRDAVNKPWLEMFPDENDRRARHAITAELRGGMLVQLEVIAVV